MASDNETVAELQRRVDKQKEINKELVDENAKLKAALVASNDDLQLARAANRSMYDRLNAEHLRITEMDRETIHILREKLKVAEDALKASLNYKNSDELRKAQHKAKNALAAIRESQKSW